MRISRDGTDWGEMRVEQDENRVQFHASGALPKYGEILRVWGVSSGAQPLLIGVAEPSGDGLAVERSMTKQYLSSFGYWPQLPQRYYAGVRPPDMQEDMSAPDDPLVQQAMQDADVTVQEEQGIHILSCTFAKDRAFPLAFACCSCTVHDGRAQLLWDREKGCPVRTAP